MYCTGQTPLSILNVSFDFVALVRTFFPFLSRVRIWICWFVFFPSTSASAVFGRQKKHMREGRGCLGWALMWLSWGFFCSYHSTVYTLLHNNYVLSLCVFTRATYHTYLGGGGFYPHT